MGQNNSIDTHPESHIIRCPTEYREGCCPTDIVRFDTSGAKQHQRLLKLIGELGGPSEIDRKFDELGMKMEQFNGQFNVVVLVILSFIPLVNLVMLCVMCCLDKRYKLVESHFEDWGELGIKVQYVNGSGEREYQGRIETDFVLILLPLSIA